MATRVPEDPLRLSHGDAQLPVAVMRRMREVEIHARGKALPIFESIVVAHWLHAVGLACLEEIQGPVHQSKHADLVEALALPCRYIPFLAAACVPLDVALPEDCSVSLPLGTKLL